MDNKFTVFSLQVANKLAAMGFSVIGTGINLKNAKYKTFFFEDSEELREAIRMLTKKVAN